jgi:hypothetical protein
MSSAENLSSMFKDAQSFNNGGSGEIGTWNTGSVTDMSSMFDDAVLFNQNYNQND